MQIIQEKKWRAQGGVKPQKSAVSSTSTKMNENFPYKMNEISETGTVLSNTRYSMSIGEIFPNLFKLGVTSLFFKISLTNLKRKK